MLNTIGNYAKELGIVLFFVLFCFVFFKKKRMRMKWRLLDNCNSMQKIFFIKSLLMLDGPKLYTPLPFFIIVLYVVPFSYI
ncbi:MAG: hypothetical protein EXX96DRAFT_551201 [Benjaminiella poitrasii]|nr:MAG: hypothetical protein EXX96DRAFT_551201 [Benjaminiella poitrasii]